jgi:hypothetical protein
MECNRAAMSRDDLDRAPRQRHVPVEAALDLHDQRDTAGDRVEEVLEGRDAIVGAAGDRGRRQLMRAALLHGPGAACEALQGIIMEHHGLAVGGILHVAFDGVAALDRGSRRGHRVLDYAPAPLMQAPVSDGPGDQPVGRAHRTSNMPSTSTAASSGSSATPIVERA